MISVILPAYNREKFIEYSIVSVLNQTYIDFELLVVDDGSEDSTVEIVERLMNNDRRIKLIKASHKGVSSARNLALENAKGEYIFFMDSDDCIHPDLLKILSDKMADKEINMAFCRYMPLLSINQMRRVMNSPAPLVNINPHFEEFSEEEYTRRIVEESFPYIDTIGGKLFRKSVIDGMLFNTQLILGEDTIFTYEYALHKGKTAVCDEKLYYYLFHNDNSIRKCKRDLDNFEQYVKALYLLAEEEATRGNMIYARQWNKKAFFRLSTHYHFALRKGKFHAANRIRKKIVNEIKKTASAEWQILYTICFFSPNAFSLMQEIYWLLIRKQIIKPLVWGDKNENI
ncbi:MAG: glycosyltransferase family 2 protein [Oscillospiraceae bacterium]|nr:glycosyltransferase family 2 protein [Oscillospiraceae bacterium]